MSIQKKLAAAAGLAGLAISAAAFGHPESSLNLPVGVTPISQQAHYLHMLTLWVCVGIAVVVFGAMIYSMVKFRKSQGAVADTSIVHSTKAEIIWTIIPVLILIGLAVPATKGLIIIEDTRNSGLTVKATGYQWYWGYEYPDQKVGEFISNILPEAQANAKGVPYRLAATEPLVVPVNAVVRVQVTGADVIHAFAVPSFGIIADAVPGRLNETWFKANRIGTYYGNCRELCGVEHAFMPIEVKVVSQADFDAWVAKKGGSVGGATPAPVEAAPAAAAVATPAAATVAAATPEPKAGGTPAGTPAPSAPAAK